MVGLPVYFACARIYNSKNNNSTEVTDDTNKRSSNQASIDDLSIDATKDSQIINEQYNNNDAIEFIKNEELEIVTVHNTQLEKEEQSEIEVFITTDESETNSAIKMLDNVLEGETETDSVNSDKSIEDDSYESETSRSSFERNETVDELRADMLLEIEEIFNIAHIEVIERIKMRSVEKTDSNEYESVFNNTTFLNRLNYLIAQSSPHSGRNSKLINQTKTMESSKSLHVKQLSPTLSQSKSEPDLQHLLKPKFSLVNEEIKEADVSDKISKQPRAPPLFSEELLKKVSTIKSNEIKKEPELQNDEKITTEKTEDFREKLEKLLQSKTLKQGSTTPIPTPRITISKDTISDSAYMNVKKESTDPLRNVQRELFVEVLKNIKKKDDDSL